MAEGLTDYLALDIFLLRMTLEAKNSKSCLNGETIYDIKSTITALENEDFLDTPSAITSNIKNVYNNSTFMWLPRRDYLYKKNSSKLEELEQYASSKEDLSQEYQGDPLAETMSSEEKLGGLIFGIVISLFGIIILTFFGNNSIKGVGWFVLGFGGLSTIGVVSAKVDDSEEAQQARKANCLF